MSPQPSAQRDDARVAYEAIAPVYDEFTAHHDFDLWLNNLFPKLEKHGLTGDRLLDVGCGTGKSFLSMLRRGWRVTGCDVSAAMLEVARQKAGDDNAELVQADMRELPVLGSFNLVWALDDAINYLLSQGEFVNALEGMRRNLAPTGLLMFDVNTIEVFRTFFAEEVVVEHGDSRLTWRGLGSPDFESGSIAEAEFSAFPKSGPPTPIIPVAIHRERHFSEQEVLEALRAAGLECLDVYGHEDDAIPRRPLDEGAHTKAVYIARNR